METNKYQARRQILARRRQTSELEQQAAASAMAMHIDGLNLQAGDIVALYSPIKGEVPTAEIAKALKAKGVQVAYPFAMANGSMVFHLNTGTFVEDQLGIMATTGEVVTPNVVFTPLVAFDRAGNRLGYGKGYYDKALAQLALESSRPLSTIGLAYSWQEIAALPTAAHDVPLHQIWTETEVIKCQQTK